MQVDLIIQRFGGLAAMTRALDLKYSSVPQGWQKRGTIPARHIPKIIAAAKENGIELKLTDFFPDVDSASGASTTSGK